VGTPGFWKNHPEVWDGDTSNDSSFAGKANFPESDVAYPVVDPVDGGPTDGILIGDWNLNGVCDPWENDWDNDASTVNCIYYNQQEALRFLDGTIIQDGDLAGGYDDGKDKRQAVARSLIAAWLNTLASNDFTCIEDSINDGIHWLQQSNGVNNTPDENGDGLGDGDLKKYFRDFRVKAGWDKDPDNNGEDNPKSQWIKSSWNSSDPNSVAGELIYLALDNYNNTGGSCSFSRG
jgi:hypothetical protein